MLYLLEFFLALILFLWGSCIFSFLNVVIYRVPLGKSFVTGRSACPACGHELSMLDMIPILSWLSLRGRCRYCGAPVSPRYSLVEGLGGIAALLSVWRFGWSVEALFSFAFFCVLTVVSFVDMDTMEIPDGFVLTALLLAALHLPFTGEPFPFWGHLIGFFCVSAPLFLVTVLIPEAFGGGDIKLMAACGLFLGWRLTLVSFFFAVLMGGVWGIFLMASGQKGRKDHFAFGPCLCLGMALSVLWGDAVLHWYLVSTGLDMLF